MLADGFEIERAGALVTGGLFIVVVVVGATVVVVVAAIVVVVPSEVALSSSGWVSRSRPGANFGLR